LLKHISFASFFFSPVPFQHYWQSGSAYRRNLCNIYVRSQSYKLLSESKSTMMEYSDFYRFEDVLFTINHISSQVPFVYDLWTFLRPNISPLQIQSRPEKLQKADNSVVTVIWALSAPSVRLSTNNSGPVWTHFREDLHIDVFT
jgi:hypothetical protein